MTTNRVSKTEATESCLQALDKLGVYNIQITAYSKSLLFLGDLDEDTILIGVCSFFNGLITDSVIEVLPLVTIRISRKIIKQTSFDDIIQILRKGILPENLDNSLMAFATILGIINAIENRNVIDCCIIQAFSKNKDNTEGEYIEHVAGTVVYGGPEDVLDTSPIKVLECCYNELTKEEFKELKEYDKDVASDIIGASGIKPRVIGVEPDEIIDSKAVYDYLMSEQRYTYEDIIDALIEQGTLSYDSKGNLTAHGYKSIDEFFNDLDSVIHNVLSKRNEKDSEEDAEEC